MTFLTFSRSSQKTPKKSKTFKPSPTHNLSRTSFHAVQPSVPLKVGMNGKRQYPAVSTAAEATQTRSTRMRRSSRKGDDFTEAGTHCETTGRHEEQHQYLPPLIDTEGTRTFVACYDSKVTNFTSTKSQKSLRLAHGPWRYIDASAESVLCKPRPGFSYSESRF